jgi:hypothetical protein
VTQSSLELKAQRSCGSQDPSRFFPGARVVVAVALLLACTEIVHVQTARPPAAPKPDVCEIGDVDQMSPSGPTRIDYAGTWVLNLSRSENLPALWRSATSATLVVAQDAERLTPVLTLVGPSGPMPYTNVSYRLDGSTQRSLGGLRGQTRITSGLRYADGGKALVLRVAELVVLKDADLPAATRSQDPEQAKDLELLHTTTQRWELVDGGRVLQVCRMLKGPLTRTVTKLVFVKK